jgi:ABC-2 type transport system permease protein
MMSGGLIAFLLLKDRVDTTDKRVAIIDHSGLVQDAVLQAAAQHNTVGAFDRETGKKIRPLYHFESVRPDPADLRTQRLLLSDRIRRAELHAFVEVGPGVLHPLRDPDRSRISYYANNPALDELRRWVAEPINLHLRKLRLAEAGIDESRASDLFYWTGAEGLGLVTREQATGDIREARTAGPIEALAVPIVIMMILFLMIMMCVPGMVTSVMEEKTQRIAEVLLGSITPFQFMAAKVIGGIGVALTSSAVYVVGGIAVLYGMDLQGYIPFHALPWFFVYMLLAIIMFGSLAAALGSTCSEAKDAQSLHFPAILPAVLPMFIYMPVAREPLGSFATWTSLFPPFTPLLMILRLCTPEKIPAWQPFAGLAGVLLFTFLFVWAGGRLFRVAILMQGTPPKLVNMIRWVVRG